jgi:hypothetical protein
MDGRDFQLQLDAGDGLLSARALWAALVGPHRLAMAQAKSTTLSQQQPVEITKILGAADAYVFVGVALPASVAPGTAIPVIFSRESEPGENTGAPAVLIPSMVGGTFFQNGFGQLLQPGEQLYAKLATTSPVATQRVVVAKVMF